MKKTPVEINCICLGNEICKSWKNKMAGTRKENGRGSDGKEDGGRKTVCRKKKRKTAFEMDGRCGSRSEGNEDKAVGGGDEI